MLEVAVRAVELLGHRRAAFFLALPQIWWVWAVSEMGLAEKLLWCCHFQTWKIFYGEFASGQQVLIDEVSLTLFLHEKSRVPSNWIA